MAASEQPRPGLAISQPEWRATVNEVGNNLLALPEGAACPAHPVADFLGERASHANRTDLKKAECYAAAKPAIGEVAAMTLIGDGRDTRFNPDMFTLKFSPKTADNLSFVRFIGATLYDMEFFVEQNATERYQTFADGAMKHAYHNFLYPSAIARGCHPREIDYFGRVTTPLIRQHELTRHKNAERRRQVAHELSAILMGRAMQNIANLGLRPGLDTMVGKVDMVMRGGEHRLIDARTRRPIPPGHNYAPPAGPTLKCPAHDYLPRFIAAGVNLIADAGYYGQPRGGTFVNWTRDKLSRS